MTGARRLAFCIAACLATALPAFAQDGADFYRGKTLELLIGAAAGGAYDLPGRTIARHMGKHIPGNPTMVVRNMPGANSMTMANHLFNVAPADGTTIGMPNINLPLDPLLRLGGDAVKFDVTKFQWIGAPLQEIYVTFVSNTAPVKTIEDLRKTEVLMGATSAAGENVALPSLMNALAGTRMKIVKGYAGQNEVFIAVERGEVHGNTTGLTNLKSEKAEWVKSGKIRVLLQYGLRPSPDLKDVPSALDLATNDEDRDLLRFFLSKYQMARVLFAPPGVPAERVAILRRAFDATMKDPAFLTESATVGLDISPTSGEEVAALIARLYATPPAIVERLRSLLLAGRK